MKKILLTLGTLGALGFGAAALAGAFDLKTACAAYVEANPDEFIDCDCLVKEVGDDAEILANIEAVSKNEAELSEASLEKVLKCVPAQ